MTEIIMKEGLEYTASNNRMRYNPEFHENHGNPWTVQELIYLCSSWDGMHKADIAAALGRTHSTVLSKAYELRRDGEFNYYKEMG
ncbi:DNA-entry nuclease [Lentibacillus sp. N15]|uniref:DNA-entry nuclease n=1 Tax=Lentibacillus songyuanensis TaxID=3136161 RepID=UPI0031BAE002